MESVCRAPLFVLVNMVGLPRDDARAAICKPTRHALAARTEVSMLKAAKRKRSSDDVGRLTGCEMELARGASHIASMLYEHSIRAAVREILLQFEACHGPHDVKAFAHALLGRLARQARVSQGDCDFIEHGRLPEQTHGTPPGPASTRKPVAPKQRLTQPLMSRAAATTESG